MTNLVRYEKIETTEARAKELRRFIEPLITHAKKQNLASLRRLMQYLPKAYAYKLYHVIAPRYRERKGGHTRVIKLSKQRAGDGAKMARIEFV